MPGTGPQSIKEPFATGPEYRFLLFVTGATPNSLRAVTNVKRLCEEKLRGRYTLEIVDIYQHKELASEYQLVALPMLIKQTPLPERKMVGDFSDVAKLLTVLDIT